MSTKDRIVQKSIELFNRYGVQNVPIHRIAAELGISPGNLTYHFKTKDILVRSIFPLIEEEMRAALTPSDTEPRPLSPEYCANFQIRIARSLWKFRFFFSALQVLLEKDPELEAEYFKFHDWALEQFQSILDAEIKASAMRLPSPPHSTAIIALNQWNLWQSWLYFEFHNAKESDLVENLAIYHGIIQNFSLLFPLCTDKFNRAFVKKAEQLLGIDPKSVSVSSQAALRSA